MKGCMGKERRGESSAVSTTAPDLALLRLLGFLNAGSRQSSRHRAELSVGAGEWEEVFLSLAHLRHPVGCAEGGDRGASTINKHWEAELAALKGNNAKLTAALLESTANVKQWKQQLAAYQEEAERLHKRVTELECVSGQSNVIKSQKTELNHTIEELESTLKEKEEELERLKEEVDNANQLQAQRDSLTQKLQETETRNKDLESQLSELEQRLESSQLEQESFRNNLKTLLEILDGKIFELTELRDNLAKLIEGS
ncbi:hypothetical protein AAFF_G00016360 [Aldrovandia affinis]|uniref:Homer scaffold protein 1 n=1 Tax=Aldrovandia affinis TaxID=143900 RepID=A0AAD7WH99_9TELE|nr:hypothetical protein AAFF_G00016360 [Aldrovandia affinis]